MKNPAFYRDIINEGRQPTEWSQGFQEGKGRVSFVNKRGNRIRSTRVNTGNDSVRVWSPHRLPGNRGGNGTSGSS